MKQETRNLTMHTQNILSMLQENNYITEFTYYQLKNEATHFANDREFFMYCIKIFNIPFKLYPTFFKRDFKFLINIINYNPYVIVEIMKEDKKYLDNFLKNLTENQINHLQKERKITKEQAEYLKNKKNELNNEL